MNSEIVHLSALQMEAMASWRGSSSSADSSEDGSATTTSSSSFSSSSSSSSLSPFNDRRLGVLLTRQARCGPQILAELRAHGEKRTCWIWWIYPTDREGALEPHPRTAVSAGTTAPWLLVQSPPSWRAVLEEIGTAIAARGMRLGDVLPATDHGRLQAFVPFWRGVLEEHPCDWLSQHLDSLMPPLRSRNTTPFSENMTSCSSRDDAGLDFERTTHFLSVPRCSFTQTASPGGMVIKRNVGGGPVGIIAPPCGLPNPEKYGGMIAPLKPSGCGAGALFVERRRLTERRWSATLRPGLQPPQHTAAPLPHPSCKGVAPWALFVERRRLMECRRSATRRPALHRR